MIPLGVANFDSLFVSAVFVLQKDVGSTSFSEGTQGKLPETESFIEALPVSAYCVSFRIQTI